VIRAEDAIVRRAGEPDEAVAHADLPGRLSR
jgi:hypothetical protein